MQNVIGISNKNNDTERNIMVGLRGENPRYKDKCTFKSSVV